MPITLDGTNGITTPTYGGADTSEYLVPVTQFKNRIINGQMQIDQRNAGASVSASVVNANTYTIDRWRYYANTVANRFTVQQNAGSVTPPAGFVNYVGITSSAANSPAATDEYIFGTTVEGFNIADLGWGTANAQAVTLSFWVRSSLTGNNFGAVIKNSAANRSYPFNFTVSAANTWEYKTVTIAGDTTGTWFTNNSIGIQLNFNLGTGSTFLAGSSGSWTSTFSNAPTGSLNILGTNGATFYITGVQLEVGSTATSFDYRPYGTELALCQRYGQLVTQQQNSGDTCSVGTATNVKFQFPVTMRSAPTASLITAGSWIVGNGYSANYTASSASISAQQLTNQGGRVQISGFTTFGSNFFVSGTDVSGTAVMFMSSEL